MDSQPAPGRQELRRIGHGHHLTSEVSSWLVAYLGLSSWEEITRWRPSPASETTAPRPGPSHAPPISMLLRRCTRPPATPPPGATAASARPPSCGTYRDRREGKPLLCAPAAGHSFMRRQLSACLAHAAQQAWNTLWTCHKPIAFTPHLASSNRQCFCDTSSRS